MYFTYKTISIAEVPNEISLIYSISGCGKSCKDCHSPELQSKNGDFLSLELFEKHLQEYKRHISCVCFLGGNWYDNFELYCQLAKQHNKKVCLYTGDNDIEDSKKQHLDYLKIGPFIKELGGLENKNTNQKFIDLSSNTLLNYLFLK